MVPPEIIRTANATWETRGRARVGDPRHELLLWDGTPAGFITPHETSWGWRLGPIFILPQFRRRGLVLEAYRARQHLTMLAFVADDNGPSAALHRRAGFTTWRRGNGGVFVRREASS